MQRYFTNTSSSERPPQVDIIPVEAAGTLSGLFRERVRRVPDGVAYRDFNLKHGNWRDYTCAQMQRQIARWQAGL